MALPDRAGGESRTHNRRFTKPVLCQLSYASDHRAMKFRKYTVKGVGRKGIFPPQPTIPSPEGRGPWSFVLFFAEVRSVDRSVNPFHRKDPKSARTRRVNCAIGTDERLNGATFKILAISTPLRQVGRSGISYRQRHEPRKERPNVRDDGSGVLKNPHRNQMSPPEVSFNSWPDRGLDPF